MSDDRILPVCEIDRTIGRGFDVSRTEIGVGGCHDRFGELDPGETGTVFLDLVLHDSLQSDHVSDQQAAAHLFGEVAAGKILDRRTRSRSLFVDCWRRTVFVGKIEMAGKEGRIVRW